MKIIHCGDIHLDSKMESNLSKEKAKERKNEILMTFINMVKYARENDVQVILIAGDLFDTKRVSAKTRNLLTECIKSNQNIDFLYLRGNHDANNFISEMTEVPINLKQFGDEWITYHYGNVSINGIEISNENYDSIYNSLILNKNETNIVILHGQESKYADKDKTEVINLTNLKNRYIDYLALGHIHSYKLDRLDNRGMYCYCGCLEGRGFDECGDKGFVLLTLEAGNVATEFVSFAKRTFYEIPVDITNGKTTSDILEAIESKLIDISPNSLIKVVLIGKLEIDTEKDITYLTQKLGQRFYFVKVYDKTKLAINVDDYQYDISLKGEFIRLVMSTKLSDEEKEQIIINGINALSGEDID